MQNGNSFRPYFFPVESFTSFSFIDVARDKVGLEAFRGKLVVAGIDLGGRSPHYLYPIDKKNIVSSLVIQTNTINSLLTGQVFVEANRFNSLVLLVVLNILAGVFFSRARVIQSAMIGLVCMFGYLGITFYFFNDFLLIDNLYTPASIGLTFALTHTFLHGEEALKRKNVEEIFGKYLKPEIVRLLVKIPEKALESLKGIKGEITVLFADIRGFTAFCENSDSEEAVNVLNRMLDAVTTAIFEQDGTVDKYIGDAVMALFNVPQDQVDHADKAVKAALRLTELVDKLGEELPVKLSFGVGINTGEAVIGNIGSPRRLEYTAIGDSVNIAARICSLAQGGEVLITESTKRNLKSKYKIEYVGEKEVRGKTQKVRVYRVIKEM